MGADSPDDSLLFAGRLPGAGPGAPVGGGQRFPAAGVQPARRGRGDRAAGASLPALRGRRTRPARRAWSWCGASRATRSRPSCRSRRWPATTTPEQVQAWFAAGADEVITGLFSPAEQRARLDAMLVRTERDVSVHPVDPAAGHHRDRARDPAPAGVGDQEFAVCYADLDHFKEFNDRYSYYDGDRVIYLLSRILHDVVKGLLGPRGFVGHIGGDDFIFIIPAAEISPVCSEILDGVRHADPAAVQRAGPAGRLLLRQGPPRASCTGCR